MENPGPPSQPPAPPAPSAPSASYDSQDPHDLESQSEFSNFFTDVKIFWDKFGTPVVGVLAVVAIIFAGYNLITKRAEQARQNAWLDLYGSTTPESLDVVVQSTKNPAVRTAANLRAADLLLAESNTATEEDAAAILTTAAGHYQAALDDAPHVIYKLNALDGLGVVAESRYDADAARKFYEQLKTTAGDAYPYWAELATQRLALLPTLKDAVVFAPEMVEPGNDSEAPDPSAAPDATETDPMSSDIESEINETPTPPTPEAAPAE